MFDKKTNTYTFCKRELIETLLSLADSQSDDVQASLLCSANVLAALMPVQDFVKIEGKKNVC